MRGGASDRLYSAEFLSPEEIFCLLKQQAEEELAPYSDDPEMIEEYTRYCALIAGLEQTWRNFMRALPGALAAGLQGDFEESQLAWQKINEWPALAAHWHRTRESFRRLDQETGEALAAALETGQAHALAL